MTDKVEKIVQALLYEGYLLYPYRKSALKNRQRFNFGLLSPADHFQTEILALGESPDFSVSVRFLQTQHRQIVDQNGETQDKMEIDGRIFESWDEAIERRIDISETGEFNFPGETRTEDLAGGKAKFVRSTKEIRGRVEIEKVSVKSNLHRFSVKIFNCGFDEQFISTHAVLSAENGEFVSLLEFPEELRNEIELLENKGLFPVLIEKDVMLASPIILYDYPQVAPESPVDFYDATEIDELLTLRVLTMTEAEKAEAAALDPRAARILRQAEMTDQMSLHGTVRQADLPLKVGTKVRLCPKKSADAFDLFLAGQTAVIESIEEDFEGRRHFAVVLDTDEGRDFGFDKFIGHRFFFGEEELIVSSER